MTRLIAIRSKRRVYCRASGRTTDETLPRNTILLGDVVEQLRQLRAESIDAVVTSPPYYLLRNYGTPDQLGLEATVDDYVERLVAVCDELARVLKPTGSLWLNLGDSYSRHARFGARRKSLLLAPERVVIALADRGWIVRNRVVWHKSNPMPASVGDRLISSWEHVYFLTRSDQYFFDLDAVREPYRSKSPLTRDARHEKSETRASHGDPRFKYSGARPTWAGPYAGSNGGLHRNLPRHPLGKAPGDVWTLATASYHEAHFATFPPRLIERPLRATCPARVCQTCGRAWVQAKGVAIRPGCTCAAGWRPGLVLDPFMGAGTTAVVAKALGRDYLGIELNRKYRAMALNRIAESGGASGTKERR